MQQIKTKSNLRVNANKVQPAHLVHTTKNNSL